MTTTTKRPAAAGQRQHEFVPLPALVSTQCAVCYGWRDDPRHPLTGGPVVGR